MASAAAAIGAAVAGASAANAIPGTTGLVIGSLITTGLNYVNSQIFGMTPLADRESQLENDLTITIASPAANIPVVYGQRMIGGLAVFAGTSRLNYVYLQSTPFEHYHTDDTGVLHLMIVLSEGEIEEVERLEVEYGGVWQDADDAMFAIPSVWTMLDGTSAAKFVDWEYHEGEADQAADADAITKIDEWTSTHRLRGLAYLHLKLIHGINTGDGQAKIFSGLPALRALTAGRKVYDFRDPSHDPADPDTWEYSTNPALIIRDYLTNSIYGRAIADSYIDDGVGESFETAANYCDVPITVPGGTQKRYECNAYVDTGQYLIENLDRLLSSCRGMLFRSNGKYKLVIDGITAKTIDFTEDNIVGAIDITLASAGTQLNRARVRYIDPDNEWQNNYEVCDSSALRELYDNNRVFEDEYDLPCTINGYTAQHIGNININQSREAIVARFEVFIEGLLGEVGDVAGITHSDYGWSAKLFRIIDMRLTSDDRVLLTVLEYDDSVYNYGSINEKNIPADTTLPDPFSALPPYGIVAEEELYTTTNSAGVKVKVNLTWEAPEDPYIDQYQVEYKLSDSDQWIEAGRTQNLSYSLMDFTPEPDDSYDFRVKMINSMNYHSAYATIWNVSILGLTAPPSDISNLRISKPGDSIIALEWDALTADSDLDVRLGGQIVIRHSTETVSPDWDDNFSGIAWSVAGTNTMAMFGWLTGSFMVKALDSSGNYSETAAVVNTDSLPPPGGYTHSTTVQEDSSFSGVKTDLIVSGTDLKLDTGETTGTYAFAIIGGSPSSEAVIDLGSTKESRLTLDIGAAMGDEYTTIDDRTDVIDDWPDFDGNAGAEGSSSVQVYGTDDDPTSSPAWTDLGVLTASIYNFRAFKFVLTLTVESDNYNILVSRLRVLCEYNADGAPRAVVHAHETELLI